jgi:hypothetical protein
MEPSIGRIVHYIPQGSTDCVAALITMVNNAEEGNVNLITFPPHAPPTLFWNVPEADPVESPNIVQNSWHWPEFVL